MALFLPSLPPVITAAAKASIAHLKNSDKERVKHQEVVAKIQESFKKAGISFYRDESHIVPIIIGDPEKTRLASQLLIDRHNIFVQHINFPTVPRGTERARITPTPAHTDQMIEQLTLALVDVFGVLEIKLKFEEAA